MEFIVSVISAKESGVLFVGFIFLFVLKDKSMEDQQSNED